MAMQCNRLTKDATKSFCSDR